MMPAVIKPYGVMGIKVLSVFPENYKKNLSSHQGIIHLFETENGKLIMSADADEITAIRTAAVSAMATDYLAKDQACNICMIGSGKQAFMHLKAIKHIRNIKSVFVWSNSKTQDKLFATKVKTHFDIDVNLCENAEMASKDADIICTVSGAQKPVLKNKWLKKGVHINAIGACTPNARELESDIILNSDVFIDNYLAISNESGDLLFPAEEQNCDIIDLINNDLHALIKSENQQMKTRNTVFKSVGVAMEDIAAINFCYQKVQNNKFVLIK